MKLLSATALGDRKSFETLYQKTSGQLYAVSLQMLRDQSLAEDALQDAYISIWHNAGEYRNNRGTVLTWMTSIIRYRALDMLRAKKAQLNKDRKQQEQPRSHITENESPEVALTKGHNKIKLDACLETLEKPQADAINLAYFQGYTHREICQHMLSPLGSVKSWIRRGLQRLKGCLEL